MTVALIIALVVIACLGLYAYHLKRKHIEIVAANAETIFQNRVVQQELDNKRQELEQVNQTLVTQKEIVESLSKTADEMRQGASKRAQEEYEAKKAELETKLKEYQAATSAEIEKQIAIIVSRKEREAHQLKDLEDKQLAYIQARQRQEEMNSQCDYYRLAISNDDKSDISLLRDLQKHLIKKDSVDKVIYETYYRPAYDILMSHLFNGIPATTKTSGIYKITDLTSGLAYIGQSVDIRERFRQHIKASLAHGVSTNRLYQTMQKSGQFNFTFEILEQVPRDKLNEREVYWIDFYKTKEFGLNSTRGNIGQN